MIESRYWRTELREDLIWLKKHRAYGRLSEKQLVLFERRLMLVAFQVRSLLERPKVSDRARSTEMPVLRYKKVGDRPFATTGSGWPHERFEMQRPEPAFLSALDVCNQLIHYYWMQTWSEGKSFTFMLVFSDYMRHKWGYAFRIEDLLQLFCVFSEDSSAIVAMESEWNDRKQDYVVKKAWGLGDLQADHSLLLKPDGAA